METNNNHSSVNIDLLIQGLAREDSRYRKITQAGQFFYWLLIPVYILLMIVDDSPMWSINQLANFCYVLSFISFALLLRYIYKEYAAVDYSLPTVQMLKNVVKRYKLWRPYLLFLIIPLVLMDIGLCIRSSIDFPDKTFKHILIIQAIYWGLLVVSVSTGIVIWYYRSKPLRDQALELLKELD